MSRPSGEGVALWQWPRRDDAPFGRLNEWGPVRVIDQYKDSMKFGVTRLTFVPSGPRKSTHYGYG